MSSFKKKQPRIQLIHFAGSPLGSYFQFNSVQLLSSVWLFVTPMDCSTPGFPIHHQLLELSQTHVQWVGDAIQPYCPLSSLLKEYSGLISFRIDWFDLLAVQGTLKSLLKHHSSKASILWHSAFFMVQYDHIHTWLLEKPYLWPDGPLLAK